MAGAVEHEGESEPDASSALSAARSSEDLVFIHVWLVMGGGTVRQAERGVKSGRISTQMIGLMTGSKVPCVSKAPSPRRVPTHVLPPPRSRGSPQRSRF